jgi:tRNA threonylcarbamoyladenosine biosynthesis protein TsaE
MEWIYRLPDIDQVAREFWQNYPDRKIIAFHGDMGAGKTSFIRALCQIKNVTENVSSPTFSLINEYSFINGIIYHLDLYRLKDEDEAIRAGIEDCLYSGDICLVEWPERATRIFPADTLQVYIEALDESTRKLYTSQLIGKKSG